MYSMKSNENINKRKNGRAKNEFVNNIKEWTGGHSFTSDISLNKLTLLGKQITARQLAEL